MKAAARDRRRAEARAAAHSIEAPAPTDPALVRVEVDLREFAPIHVGVPVAADFMYTEAVVAINAMTRALPPGSKVDFGCKGLNHANNRALIAGRFLESPDAHALLWCDADAVPTKWAPAQLLWHMREQSLDILSAHFVSRHPPYSPAFETFADQDQRPRVLAPVHEVARVGHHFTLVHRRVFEGTPRPWFLADGKPSGHGEDYRFCDRARAAGFRVWLDQTLQVGHLALQSLTPEWGAFWQGQHPDESRRLIDLGSAGEMLRLLDLERAP